MCALPLTKIPLLVVLLLVLPLFAAPGAAGEDPHNQSCVGALMVRLLCAGADAGGNADCDNEANDQPDVRCTYTYGWNLNASSLLPGGGRLDWSYEVTYCLDDFGCGTIEEGTGTTECTWVVDVAKPCVDQEFSQGTSGFRLSLGQCVVVTARVWVSAESWAPDEDAPVLHAVAADDGEGGAASCYLDNGRD